MQPKQKKTPSDEFSGVKDSQSCVTVTILQFLYPLPVREGHRACGAISPSLPHSCSATANLPSLWSSPHFGHFAQARIRQRWSHGDQLPPTRLQSPCPQCFSPVLWLRFRSRCRVDHIVFIHSLWVDPYLSPPLGLCE